MADLRDQEVIYSGKRFVIRDGEEVEAWEVYRNGERFLGKRGKVNGYIWGSAPINCEFGLKALSLVRDVIDDLVTPCLKADVFVALLNELEFDITRLPDDWVLARSDALKFIDQFETSKRRRCAAANKYNRAALAILEVLGDRVDYVQYRENRNARRNDEGLSQVGSALDLSLSSAKNSTQAHEHIDLPDDAEDLSSDDILGLSVKAVEQFLNEDDCKRCGRAYSEDQREEILANAKARLTAVLQEEVRHD